jgi:Nitroreductase family
MTVRNSNGCCPALWRETMTWAKHVPVLALGIVSLKFAKNGKDNRAAVHDLGLAAGNLVVEATARGLHVHQMIGILPDKAREVFGIPEGYEAWTGIAIGYEGDPATLPDNLKQRDLTPKQRKPLKEFVFTGKWGNPAPFLAKRWDYRTWKTASRSPAPVAVKPLNSSWSPTWKAAW